MPIRHRSWWRISAHGLRHRNHREPGPTRAGRPLPGGRPAPATQQYALDARDLAHRPYALASPGRAHPDPRWYTPVGPGADGLAHLAAGRILRIPSGR